MARPAGLCHSLPPPLFLSLLGGQGTSRCLLRRLDTGRRELQLHVCACEARQPHGVCGGGACRVSMRRQPGACSRTSARAWPASAPTRNVPKDNASVVFGFDGNGVGGVELNEKPAEGDVSIDHVRIDPTTSSTPTSSRSWSLERG